MKVTAVEWDTANQEHFDEHRRCARRQVEDVLFGASHPSRARLIEGSDGRFRFEGQTRSRRYLVVIAERKAKGVFRPITCWPLSGKRLVRYQDWRKAVKE